MTSFAKDFHFWLESESKVGELFEKLWRTVQPTTDTDILDFKIIDKNKNEVWLELKTRRCAINTYPDTMIGLNKLIEAYKRYNKEWLYTIFVFQFTDWLYYINPFFALPRFDYRRGRYDRGGFDQEKGWIYYQTKDLIKLK